VVDPRRHHLKGRGGVPGAICAVAQNTMGYHFVIKSDIANYYVSMQHHIVLKHVQAVVYDKKVLRIITQYLTRVEVQNGHHSLIHKGIPKGCPLSPLLDALMLKSLNDCIPNNCFYARYMDDWVILVKTRRQVRRIDKKIHRVLKDLQMKLAIHKTYIGRSAQALIFWDCKSKARAFLPWLTKRFKNRLNVCAPL